MATQWLEGNTHNRPLNQGAVDMLAQEIREGRWKLTHQGIAFDKDGVLIDGQHRLWAVIESGVTVPMVVSHGFELGVQTVIDTHRPRSAADRITLADTFGRVSPVEASTLKRLVKGAGAWPRWGPGLELSLFEKHRAAVQFAVSAFPGRRPRITKGPVYAVIGRAFYTQDHTVLKAFANVLFSGEIHGKGETAAILLRDALLTTKDGSAIRSDVAYLKTEAALRAYIDGRPLQRLAPATEELFPLPGEKKVGSTVGRNTRRYDMIDRIMRWMREHKTGTVTEIRKAIGVGHATPVTLALREAEKIGWLRCTYRGRTGESRKPSVYALVQGGEK
jgi:hypothetical protein